MRGITNSRTLHLAHAPAGTRVTLKDPNGGTVSVVVDSLQLAAEAAQFSGGDQRESDLQTRIAGLENQLEHARKRAEHLEQRLAEEREDGLRVLEASERAEQIVAQLEGKVEGLTNALARLGGSL
jgi:chromosome segregation ATPase